MSHANGQLTISFEDQGVRHQVVHELTARLTAEAQQHSLFRNMPRKERHKAITTMLQPLLLQYGD